MGTRVQYKMNLPGYYSITNLYDGTANDIWPSHHENKSFGQYYGIFSPWPAADEHIGHDREKLRETILRHETVFRHQLHELHRLHQKQANMMNEVRGKEPYKQPNPMVTSPSCFYAFPRDDGKRGWCDSSQPLLGADSVPSHHKLMNVDIVRSSYGSTHNASKFKDHESLESKPQKVQRKLFDLELPADNYASDDEEQEAAVGGSEKETYPPNHSFQVPCERNGNLFTQCGMYSSDALSSNMLLQRKTHGFTDLNEPIQVEEASSSASVDILGDATCYKEEIGRRESANSCSGLQFKGKEISHSPYQENYKGVGQCNRHLERERGQRECLSYAFRSGQSISNKSSLGSFHSEYLPMGAESSQAGYKEVHKRDRNKTGKSAKNFFGVEIFERKPDISAMTSDSLLHPLQRQSLGQASSILRKNLPSNTVLQLNEHPGTSIRGSEVTRDWSRCDGHVTLVPNSGAEVLYNNSLCYVSQVESKESRNGQSLVGFGCLDGNSNNNSAPDRVTQHITTNNLGSRSWLVDLNCAEVNVNSVPAKCHQKDGNSNNNSAPDQVTQRITTNNLGSRSWLVDLNCTEVNVNVNSVPAKCHQMDIAPDSNLACNDGPRSGRSFNVRNSPCVDMDSWKNYSQQPVSKAEMMKVPSGGFMQDSLSVTNVEDVEDRKTEGFDSSRNRKIFGVPIFQNMSNAVPSGNSAPKPCSEISGVNSIKVDMLLTDLNQDPLPSESGETLGTKSLKTKKGSVDTSDNLGNHIDLNVSSTEEEIQVTHFPPRNTVKIAVERDLEAPAVFEPETDVTSGDEFSGRKFKEPSLTVNDESWKVFSEGAMIVAAEALVTISSSNFIDSQDDATCNESEALAHDSLQWFAEKISSYTCYIENDALSVCVAKNSSDCEDSAPDEIDFFEYMTLNLAETKVEVSDYKPMVLENTNDDIQPPRRPQRGRARKRKDFQRDVLPSIVSLCKNDVTEDLQMLEGLVRASGGTWQYSLSERNSPKNRGRGRKRAAAKSAATSPTLTSFSPPPPSQQQPNCIEPGLEETRLEVAGWGKRTRRPSRHKYLADQPVMVQ